MNTYKVKFWDGSIRRSIKIVAEDSYGAIGKARRMRKGNDFRATLLRDDDEYLKA